MISQFTVCLPISCAVRRIAISFASSLSTIHFQFLINQLGFNSFYSHFLNGCMLIGNWDEKCHKCVKCSIWLLLITHHGPTNIIYINNIGIITKLIVWALIHYIRLSLWNFGFLRYGYYIVITTFEGFGYCFQTNFCSISKEVINTCWWFLWARIALFGNWPIVFHFLATRWPPHHSFVRSSAHW